MADPKHTEIEAAILQANAEFYRAFSSADFAAMSALWATHAPVLCIHPGTPVLVGRAAVLESWRQILQEQPSFEMRCVQPRVHILAASAIVTCYEATAKHPPHLAATNIFVIEASEWRMIHHHAGPLAQPFRPEPPANLN